jgi:hypothetical protein
MLTIDAQRMQRRAEIVMIVNLMFWNRGLPIVVNGLLPPGQQGAENHYADNAEHDSD